jgi:hypothetical protein
MHFKRAESRPFTKGDFASLAAIRPIDLPLFAWRHAALAVSLLFVCLTASMAAQQRKDVDALAYDGQTRGMQ